MTVLDQIVAAKRKSLEKQKTEVPLRQLIAACEKAPTPPSFAEVFKPGGVAVIAEMKKASPSAGVIVDQYEPARIASDYRACGAAALSVLTEENYFQGRPEHLVQAALASGLPALRKDFTVEPYQIYESRRLGASAVLLIIAILSEKNYAELIRLARDLGMDALVEVHDRRELDAALRERPKLVGINNRNLKDLSVDLETTFRLKEAVPADVAVVAESGIRSADIIRRLRTAGVQGALIGESLLKSADRPALLKSFVQAGLD